MHDPADVAAAHARLTAAHGRRFLLGIGVSHAPLIDSKNPGTYRKPLSATAAFLDGLDAAEATGAPGDRVAGRTRAEDAQARRRSIARRAPYLVSPTTPRSPGRRSVRVVGAARADRPSCQRMPTPHARSPASGCAATWHCRTTPTTCAHRVHEDDVHSVSDDWSTRSWCGATRTRSWPG
jgi:hypothetical protein